MRKHENKKRINTDHLALMERQQMGVRTVTRGNTVCAQQ